MEKFFLQLKQTCLEQCTPCNDYICYINELKRKRCTMPDCCGRSTIDISIITHSLTSTEFEKEINARNSKIEEEFETVEEFLNFASTSQTINQLICSKNCYCECHDNVQDYYEFKRTMEIYASNKKSGIYYIFLNNRLLSIYLHISDDKTMIVSLSECKETYSNKIRKNQISENLKSFEFDDLKEKVFVDTELPNGSFDFYKIQFSAMCIDDDSVKHELVWGYNKEHNMVWTCIIARDNDINFIFDVPEDFDSKMNFIESFKSFSYFVFLCYLLRRSRGFDMKYISLLNLKNRCPGHESRKEMIEMTTCMFKQGVSEAKEKSIVSWVKELQEKRKSANSEHVEAFKKILDEKLQKLTYVDTIYRGIQDVAMEKDFMQSRMIFSRNISQTLQSNVSNALDSFINKVCYLKRKSKRLEKQNIAKIRKIAFSKVKELIANNDISGTKKIISQIANSLEDQEKIEASI